MAIVTKNKTYAQGLVFASREHFYTDGMLEIRAFYYDADADKICSEQVEYIGIDCVNMCGGSWAIDLTKENALKMLKGCLKKESEKAWIAYCDKMNSTINVGDYVEVFRGRKIPKGIRGVVFYKGSKKNSYTYDIEDFCGFRTDANSEPFWIKAAYLKRVEPLVFNEVDKKHFIEEYLCQNYSYVMYMASDGKMGSLNRIK